MAGQIHDMTEGNPFRQLFLFALPVLFGNLFQQFYNMTDSIVVGRFVGVNALAAVGATAWLIFLIIGLSNGLTTGYSIIISKRFGAKDLVGARRAAAMSIILSVLIGLVTMVFGVLFARRMLIWMQVPQNVLDDSALYLTVMFAGVLITIFYNLFSAILRAFGDAKHPLYFLILASVLNIALDLFFVLVLPWGVFGVAVATLMAQLISAFLSGRYACRLPVLKFTKEDFRWDGALAKELITLGIPAALQNALIALGVISLQVVVNTMGSDAMAAYTAATRLHNFVSQSFLSVGIALSTFVGQNYGARRYDRVRHGLYCGLGIVAVISAAGWLVMRFFALPLTSLFVSGVAPEVLRISEQHLHTTSYFYPVLGSMFLYRFALQGLGNSMGAMVSSVMEVLVRTPVCIFFYWVLNLGYISVPISDNATWSAILIAVVILFYRTIHQLEKKSAAAELKGN